MRARFLRGYYLATPAFLLVDLAAGPNVRVSGLEAYPALKYGYYLFCFAAGFWALKRPHVSEGVALVESAVNIFVLILGVWLGYYGVIDQVLAGGEIVSPFRPAQLVNLVLSGTVLSISFYGNPLLRRGRAL